MYRYRKGPFQNPERNWRNQSSHPINHQPTFGTRQLLIEEAIQIARNQVPGEVVSAELERKKGRLIYEIDIVSTQGPVYEVKVDATTGEVLEIELD